MEGFEKCFTYPETIERHPRADVTGMKGMCPSVWRIDVLLYHFSKARAGVVWGGGGVEFGEIFITQIAGTGVVATPVSRGSSLETALQLQRDLCDK
ncbi:hypothetical protein JZ751_011291 [Albula glossodonta]|uniref:Uncharacterized protein n=1 Tax=Albula glossodonta TaxID=121402 RepID=A0A8T2NWR6_9TELE|nr:hypothetical protein JZ751_011291 [Albula glossodonta]